MLFDIRCAIRTGVDAEKNRGLTGALLLATALALGGHSAFAQTSSSQPSGGPASLAVQPALSQQQLDLFMYVVRDNASAVRSLLAQGTDPNVRDANGQTPLTLALQLDSLKAFDGLMSSATTNVEFRNASDESPLMMAALKGHLDAATRLLRQGALPNKALWSPLHYAASGTGEGQPELVRLLLAHNAYIDSSSPNGTTPLMMAAQYGTEKVVLLLLKEGADPTIANQLGLTATDFASRSGRESLTQRIAQAAEQLRKERSLTRAPKQP